MKKVLFSLFLITGLGVFANAQDAKKKVALTTINVNRTIDFSELNSDAAMIAAICEMSNDKDFDLQPVLDKFKTTLLTDWVPQLPIELIPENEVLNNEEYKSFVTNGYDPTDKGDFRSKLFGSILLPQGYKFMTQCIGIIKSKKIVETADETRILKIFPTADGVLFAELSFAFQPKLAIGGMGTAKIVARVSLTLFNKEGKVALRIYENASSKKSVALIKGVPVINKKDLLPMCNEAADEIIVDLNNRLPKLIKKFDKKF